MSTPAMIYLRHNLASLLSIAVAASLLGASSGAHAADAPEGSGAAAAPALPRDSFSRPIPQFSALPPAVASQLPGFEQALGAYAEEMADYNEGMLELSKNEYKRQRNGIVAFYNDGIDSRRVEERARRELAIADFNRFIEEYPSDATYTPDVLFRLGELYYEHAKDTYEQKNELYQAEMDRFERGFVADEPTPPEKEFNQAVATYERLIRDYPDYRLIDGALYLVGVLYAEAKDPRALATFERLTVTKPKSDFAQEAFLRVGEIHFEATDWKKARKAFETALTYPASTRTDKILFKLGWATYLASDYDNAIVTFQKLLDYYQSAGDSDSAALKEEALQYTAITLAEEDWNSDGNRDADFIMPRMNKYLGDRDDEDSLAIRDRVVAILLENQRYANGIELLRDAIARAPEDPQNPNRFEKIVEAFARDNQIEKALDESAKIGQLFGPGTAWYKAQERLGNTDAIAVADEMTRRSLKDTAGLYYNEGEQLAAQFEAAPKDTALRERSIQRFRLAARMYGQFLQAYPNDAESYDIQMYLAQSYFFSEQYDLAGAGFETVRESVLNDNFRDAAARFAIQSYETSIEREFNAGRLEARAWPSRPAGVGNQAPEPKKGESNAPRTVASRDAVPELSLKLISAYDRYIALGIKNPDSPDEQANFAYAGAKLYYEYKDYPEAQRRFIGVLDSYCGSEMTGPAAINLVESYRDQEDFAQMEFWADEVGRRGQCIVIKDAEVMKAFKQDITRYQMGAISQQAEALVAGGKYEEAAIEYVRLANEFAGQQNGALGLYNAGLIYEQNLKKFELAMTQFDRLLKDYPGSEWVDKALVRIAVNSRQFFDFDRAIATFRDLNKRGYSDAEGIKYPGLKAAELLDYSQRYTEAAEAYVAFVKANPRTDEAPVALYQAALNYEKAGNGKEMVKLFERFRKEYGASASSPKISIPDAVLDGLSRTAKFYEQQKDARAIAKTNQQILAEFNVRQPQSAEARQPAAKLAYEAAMDKFKKWDAIQLGETVPQQQKALGARKTGITDLQSTFEAVTDFNSADVTVCAFFMRGRVYQRMADLLYQLPIPEALADDPFAEEQYIAAIEDFASQYEDAAVKEWEIAYPIMQKIGVVNTCTIDTTRQLNRYRGSDYPVLSEPIDPLVTDLVSPQIFLPTPSAPVAEAGEAAP